jgi:putative transposase
MSTRYKILEQQGMNFMTCTIKGWVDLFTRQAYRDIVLDSWRYCQQHKGFRLHGYTFMTNHIHLIASCLHPHRLSNVMRDWKHFTATAFLEYLNDASQPESRREWLLHLFHYFAHGKRHKQAHQIWDHDNHPVALFSPDVVQQKLNYIHLNAVRAGFVQAEEQWMYSSAPFYAALADEAPHEPLIEIVPVWDFFGEVG